MIALTDFVADFSKLIESQEKEPWIIIQELDQLIREQIKTLDKEYLIDQGIAIHKTAVIDPGATIKGPAILHQNSFVGSNSLFSINSDNTSFSSGCEVSTVSVIFLFGRRGSSLLQLKNRNIPRRRRITNIMMLLNVPLLF